MAAAAAPAAKLASSTALKLAAKKGATKASFKMAAQSAAARKFLKTEITPGGPTRGEKANGWFWTIFFGILAIIILGALVWYMWIRPKKYARYIDSSLARATNESRLQGVAKRHGVRSKPAEHMVKRGKGNSYIKRG